MPQSNVHIVLGTGAIIVVTAVTAAAIAVYESPEVRQFADQCRRRIAIALHSLGEEIRPKSESESQEPRYNRPEDAEGFLQSSDMNGVDADEDSKRRQREEFMYWNRIHMEKLEREKRPRPKHIRNRGVSFDDFLHEDSTAERGTYIYNSSTDIHNSNLALLHRRELRGLDRGDPFRNPFADENQIELEEQRVKDRSLMSPEASEFSEDLYSATDEKRPCSSTITAQEQQLVDISESPAVLPALPELVSAQISYPAMQELPTTSYQRGDADMAVQGQDGQMAEAYASIHAWANDSDDSIHTNAHDTSFYSPLHTVPATPFSVASEVEDLIHMDEQAPHTDSGSLAGSGEDLGGDDVSSIADIISEDGDGINTPGSWTEVGSEVSDSDIEITEAF